MTTGERIKLARKAANLTQKELADMLNISAVNISQLENDTRVPKLDTLRKIAEKLHVHWLDILGDDDASRSVFAESLRDDSVGSNLPGELRTLSAAMHLVGYSLEEDHGEYYFWGKGGRYRLTEEQTQELLNSSVQYVEFLCEKLERELTDIPKCLRKEE